MKFLVALSIVIAAPIQAAASGTANPAKASPSFQECERVGFKARDVMLVRQIEVPMEKFIAIAKKYGEDEQYMAMMRMAYRLPKVSGADLIIDVATQFGRQYQIDCMEGRG